MLDFNINNDNNMTGIYPLFFDEPLGLFDGFNITYPEIKKADSKQRSLFWKADEIDFFKDAQDLKDVDAGIKNLMIKTLSFQMAGDSLANGSISGLFLPITTNNEAVALINYWSMSEDVHAETYAKMVAQCFDDPNEMFNSIKDDMEVLGRLTLIIDNFKRHNKILLRLANGENVTIKEKRESVIRTITTLLSLEGIMFIGSFAATFALCNSTRKFDNIAKAVGLIHDDEFVSHVRNNITLLKIIRDKLQWEEYNTMKEEMEQILNCAIDQDHKWSQYLFGECSSVVGFNKNLLDDYVLFISKPLYDTLGLDFNYKVVGNNPISWITKYVKADIVQQSPQEQLVTNYKVNATLDDSEDEVYDF